jgi:hypothetical protein
VAFLFIVFVTLLSFFCSVYFLFGGSQDLCSFSYYITSFVLNFNLLVCCILIFIGVYISRSLECLLKAVEIKIVESNEPELK